MNKRTKALRLAMAKLLPKKLKIENMPGYRPLLDYEEVFWLPQSSIDVTVLDSGAEIEGKPVLDTEWLYVMHLIEETLTPAEREEYRTWNPHNTWWDYRHATFEQRAEAMCKVKGITIP